MQVELLHESDRTRVTRLFLSGRTAIRKEPLGPDSQRRLNMSWLSSSGCAGRRAWPGTR